MDEVRRLIADIKYVVRVEPAIPLVLGMWLLVLIGIGICIATGNL